MPSYCSHSFSSYLAYHPRLLGLVKPLPLYLSLLISPSSFLHLYACSQSQNLSAESALELLSVGQERSCCPSQAMASLRCTGPLGDPQQSVSSCCWRMELTRQLAMMAAPRSFSRQISLYDYHYLFCTLLCLCSCLNPSTACRTLLGHIKWRPCKLFEAFPHTTLTSLYSHLTLLSLYSTLISTHTSDAAHFYCTILEVRCSIIHLMAGNEPR